MHAPQNELRCDRWIEGSFEITLTVGRDLLRLMCTRGQSIRGRTIVVVSGKARDSACGMLEFRDRFGIPFVWNKRLVASVIDSAGRVLWISPTKGP